MALRTWRVSRHSKQWVGPIDVVTIDGVPVTDWTYAVTYWGHQPSGGAAGITQTPEPRGVDARLGVVIGPGTANPMPQAGTYRLWVTYASGSDQPVEHEFGRIIAT